MGNGMGFLGEVDWFYVLMERRWMGRKWIDGVCFEIGIVVVKIMVCRFYESVDWNVLFWCFVFVMCGWSDDVFLDVWYWVGGRF